MKKKHTLTGSIIGCTTVAICPASILIFFSQPRPRRGGEWGVCVWGGGGLRSALGWEHFILARVSQPTTCVCVCVCVFSLVSGKQSVEESGREQGQETTRKTAERSGQESGREHEQGKETTRKTAETKDGHQGRTGKNVRNTSDDVFATVLSWRGGGLRRRDGLGPFIVVAVDRYVECQRKERKKRTKKKDEKRKTKCAVPFSCFNFVTNPLVRDVPFLCNQSVCFRHATRTYLLTSRRPMFENVRDDGPSRRSRSAFNVYACIFQRLWQATDAWCFECVLTLRHFPFLCMPFHGGDS